MRDYVTGKRQVSFPPVKMLVLLGVIVYLLGHWLSPKEYSHEIGKITATGSLYYISYAWKWLLAHEEWGTLFVFSALILPTWIVFRHAPLLKRHTLPQGFFIQVFVANQSLVLELIMLLLALLFVPYSVFKTLYAVFFLFYLFVDYKQLFGYNWWGTVWRMMMILVIIGLFVGDVGCMISVFIHLLQSDLIGIIFSLLFTLWLTYLVIYFTGVINRKAWLERGKWAVIKRPTLITLFLVLCLVVFIYIDIMK